MDFWLFQNFGFIYKYSWRASKNLSFLFLWLVLVILRFARILAIRRVFLYAFYNETLIYDDLGLVFLKLNIFNFSEIKNLEKYLDFGSLSLKMKVIIQTILLFFITELNSAILIVIAILMKYV